MADENDGIVKILIQMGLDDAAAKAAADQIKNLGQTAKETSVSMDSIPESLQGLKAGEEDASDATERLNVGHRELRRGLEELNRVFPGLGHIAALAAEGFTKTAEAELEASDATRALIESLGPIAIILLTIQAATEYWNLYNDAVKAAAEAQAEASKKIVEETQKALDVWQNYQDTIHGKKDSVTKPFEEELQRRKQIQDAEYENARQVLALQKEGALQGATTPEQRQQVEQDYAGKEAALQAQNRNAQSNNLEAVRHSVQDAMLAVRKQIEDATASSREILKEDPRLIDKQDVDQYNENTGQIKILNDKLDKLQDMFDNLTSQSKTTNAVDLIQATGAGLTAAARALQPDNATISGAVGGFSAAQQGQRITAAQQQHINDLNALYEQIFGNTELLKDALTYARDHALTITQEIQLIKTQLQTMAQQIQNSGFKSDQ